MKTLVVDASVLLKWVLPNDKEPDYSQALHIREAACEGSVLLRVPSLWIYEVGNTLARLLPNKANELMNILRRFGLEEAPLTEPYLEQTIKLTTQFNVTFYDAAYHALAILEKGMFVTADEKYVQKTKKVVGHVLSLRDWK